jgi:6-phosphofructokinase 1
MRLGVLTSGGDAPGMNAAIAGLSEAADAAGADVIGFARGFAGLSGGDQATLTPGQARLHLHEAGTWLESSRHTDLRTADGVKRARAALNSSGADGLAVIGGDGSLRGARTLASAGACVAFIPATIDNDIPGTETTIGHDSAVTYAVGVIGQLRVTGRSLRGRAFVLQTLGGQTRQLAVAVAAAAGIDDVLLTGQEEEVIRAAGHLASRAQRGDAIAVMPEAIGNAVEIAARLERHAGVRVRCTILGHAQRAAPPTATDVALGLGAGHAAAGCLLQRRSGFVSLHPGGSRVIDLLDPRTLVT